jgi:hypothetical protein
VKDDLKKVIAGARTPIDARNLVREYLQARILGSLQGAGAFMPLAFHGGTSLRFLFSIPRWSEDLDFALENPSAAYDFRSYLAAVRRDLGREGYAVELAKVDDAKVVHSGFVTFRGLLAEIGLSGHRSEALSVKLEVDTRPPNGAVLSTSIVRRHVLLRLQHHDPASLLAGKLHAVLQRAYAKGRDLYDLVWYLSDRSWPEPNLKMLNSALDQTGWRGRKLTSRSWRGAVRERIEALKWEQVVRDVRPFLEKASDEQMLDREALVALLERV